jgi:mRNA interferase MazF
MATFSQGDVVKVPFPYTDRSTRQSRPALVVSSARLQDAHNLLWVAMISSAENRGWPGDVPITALARAGLPVASVIHPAKLGSISPTQLRKVMDAIGHELQVPQWQFDTGGLVPGGSIDPGIGRHEAR